jgi:predicted dehydrogenase
VVGVAERREITRLRMTKTYNLRPEHVFNDWKDLAKVPKFADAVVIATQDQDHSEPMVALANLGYHVLLEKPMATSLDECLMIKEAVKANNIIFAVGHVLRYTAYSQKMKEILDSGIIGDIVNIQHLEPIGWFHHAHSYVRGNWRNSTEATFVLMSKCCHDIDWMTWIMGKKCTKVSSFGSIKHFNQAAKPAGATSRCLDCPLADSCAYSAKNLYLDGVHGIKSGNTSWPVSVLAEEPTIENITDALRTGPYGRCVYDCDNDVMDNQVVIMQYEDGSTATFTMVAFSEDICIRKTRIFGTKGEIEGDGEHKINVFEFASAKKTVIHPDNLNIPGMLGHGGGDFCLMKAFSRAVATNDQSFVCDVDRTFESHSLVFAAEKARVENVVIHRQEQCC